MNIKSVCKRFINRSSFHRYRCNCRKTNSPQVAEDSWKLGDYERIIITRRLDKSLQFVKIYRLGCYKLVYKGGVHRATVERCEKTKWRNSGAILYEKGEGKVEQANCAVTLTDTYRLRSRMPLSRQILAIYPAIRNIKMGPA